MSGFTLHTSARADSSPALRIIYEGVSELVQEGHFPYTGLSLGVLPDDEVVYATSGPSDLIGVLCFRVKETEIEITLAYVEASSRRMGVLNSFWSRVLSRYKGAVPPLVVRAAVHEDNKLGLQIVKSKKFVANVTSFILEIE
jgi:hypothetical protein